MFMLHTTGNCKGCGLPPERKDECDCEWATCSRCHAHDCYIYDKEMRYYYCYYCDNTNDPKRKEDW